MLLLKMVNTEYELKVFLLDTLEEAKIIADRERLKFFHYMKKIQKESSFSNLPKVTGNSSTLVGLDK